MGAEEGVSLELTKVLLRTVYGVPVAVASAVGGPEAVLAAEVLRPSVEALADVTAERVILRVQRATRAAADEGLVWETFEDKLREKPRRVDLVRAALRAASETELGPKLDALGRTMARGFVTEDDLELDLHQRLVRALAAVEAPDVLALAHARSLPARTTEIEGARKPVEVRAMNVTPADVSAVLPDQLHMEAVMENLRAAGLLVQSGLGLAGSPNLWSPTQMGLTVLEALEADGEEVAPGS